MCGIVGVIGDGSAGPVLAQCLERLEYRGYDSCGVATLNGMGIEIRKGVGPVQEVAARLEFAMAHGGLGIAHTRWATHGSVSDQNAHPHFSCDRKFAVVHNGIFTNYQPLRTELESRGHRFESDTDTEVVAHLVEEMCGNGRSVEQAFIAALQRLEGSYAVAMIAASDPEHIFCAREKSPLILGIDSSSNFVGSDVNAFLKYTRQVVLLEDGEYAVLARREYRVHSIATGNLMEKRIVHIDWDLESGSKGEYRHYMEKEICEQPDVIQRALDIPQEQIASVSRLLLEAPRKLIIGVGTTYYVALYGQYLFSLLAGAPAQAISSDEAPWLTLPGARVAMLAISQSGETFDTLQALRKAKAAGARTVAIVNMPGSTMTREVEQVILQNSGPEICVISTKAAMAQLILLTRIAAEIGFASGHLSEAERRIVLRALAELSGKVDQLLRTQREAIRAIARQYRDKKNWLFLGRGLYTPIAFESALKMKEVTYLHAEGMGAGFLKHGTLSLIDESMPCFFLVPSPDEKGLYDLAMSSVEEIRARKGQVIGCGVAGRNDLFDKAIELAPASRWVRPLLQLIAGQLLAYEMAVLLERNVDRPRSLAKSVTVS